MTEWNAAEYSRRSSLQEAMAQEVLALLDLTGSERILDVGCGEGKITAEIASRAPRASVVGVDPSGDMISFAQSHFGPATRPNLRFQVADARRLPFQDEFDLVVSFNALHWIPEQDDCDRHERRAGNVSEQDEEDRDDGEDCCDVVVHTLSGYLEKDS